MNQESRPSRNYVFTSLLSCIRQRAAADEGAGRQTISFSTPCSSIDRKHFATMSDQLEQMLKLRRFDISTSLATNEYHGLLGQFESAFHAKYPRGCVMADEFTLADLAVLLYDLLCIAHEQDRHRLKLSDLDSLIPGLSEEILGLIEGYHHELADIHDFQSASDAIYQRLDAVGLTPNDVLVDLGSAKNLPLSTNFMVKAMELEFRHDYVPC